MGIANFLKRGKECHMNSIERRHDRAKGYYMRKRFGNGFILNVYSDFLAVMASAAMGVKARSWGSRKSTEAWKYREFNRHGFSVPRLLEEGENYIDVEFIEMVNLSVLLRDRNESRRKKLKAIKLVAAEMRKIHDAGFEWGDANAHNAGCMPNGGVILFDFEHELKNGSREKEYSTFAVSSSYHISDSSDIKDILKSIAEGYGKDFTQAIKIQPVAYAAFLLRNKLGSLRELRKLIRCGIRKQKG